MNKVYIVAMNGNEYNKFLNVNGFSSNRFKNIVNVHSIKNMNPEDEWLRIGKWHRRPDMKEITEALEPFNQANLGLIDYLP